MPIKISKLVHICEPGLPQEETQIRLDQRNRAWDWHIYGHLLKIRYCPHCGEKLEQPDA